MKKSLLLTVIIILNINLQSCAIITTEGKSATKVVHIEGSNQNELYVRANNWMISAFNNADSIIQFTDKESGTITGKYIQGSTSQGSQLISSKRAFAIIQIKVKDGASKITITPESYSYAKGNPYSLHTKEKVVSDINKLMVSFEKAIQQKEDKDW
jgi:hypothetical protein